MNPMNPRPPVRVAVAEEFWGAEDLGYRLTLFKAPSCLELWDWIEDELSGEWYCVCRFGRSFGPFQQVWARLIRGLPVSVPVEVCVKNEWGTHLWLPVNPLLQRLEAGDYILDGDRWRVLKVEQVGKWVCVNVV
jgi:hypothetical protein